jgi:Glucose / Sorbosone dehydrogenase
VGSPAQRCCWVPAAGTARAKAPWRRAKLLLRGLLRVTPDRAGPGYTVPADNPYVGQPGVAPVTWAKGMRYRWRFSIDRPTGDIWLGDVGESIWEAVYRIPAGTKGVNHGWPAYEGSHDSRFNPQVPPPAERMAPVHEIGGVQTSLGQDPDGELWVLTPRHDLFELGPA